MTTKAYVFAAIVSFLLTACARTNTSDSKSQYVSRPHEDPCIKPGLVAPEAVGVGEGFTATISLTNRCDEPRTVPVDSANPANLLVITADNMIVWSLYEPGGDVPLLPPTLENIRPGEVLEFDVSWAGGGAGEPIPVGTYKLVGLLAIADMDENTAKITETFEVIKPFTVTP